MMRWLIALVLIALATPAFAESPIEQRAATVVALLRDAKADPADFAPSFLAQVPITQVEGVARQLRDANGAVVALGTVTAKGTAKAVITIDYAQATVTARLAIEDTAPHRLIGLLITGVTRKGDSLASVVADMRALPGRSALLVARLGAGAPQPVAAWQTDAVLATGSVFKLFVLAELARATKAGERNWADVVPLGAPSLPSGVMQDWPRSTPVTLSTLATQMISISDNSATDTLIAALGRPKIDAMRASVGPSAGTSAGLSPGSLPLLSTLDAFVLKMPAKAALRARWVAGGLAERRQVLNELEPTVADVDAHEFAGPPLHIDTVEWPATMSEIVTILDTIRKSASREAFDILAVNPSLAPDQKARFGYGGYKGGSETGVIAMTWLLQTRAGEWYAVAGAWNNPAAPVDNAAFGALMARAVALVGR